MYLLKHQDKLQHVFGLVNNLDSLKDDLLIRSYIGTLRFALK